MTGIHSRALGPRGIGLYIEGEEEEDGDDDDWNEQCEETVGRTYML